ncbi:hypothetical protein ABXT63_01895 [Candidatus Pelagibacter sp. Uisw_092]|uniref:hypothetical protein n=1 Tax=Candidatus Pelagibacter sp. Uisw_092 TaxID=3230979 RepID=UPI0039E904AD
MIKKIIKILSVLLLILTVAIIYLSTYGIKTERFNDKIIKNVLNINNKVQLSLNDVNYLLNPFNFTIKATTKNPKILLQDKKLDIDEVKTNISLKSLIIDQFSIDDLKISTKEIKLKDIILLARSFENSPELFILDSITKNGLISANISISFDTDGKIENNFLIKGVVKKAKFNILNQAEIKDLNLSFDITKNQFMLSEIETKLNNIKITSPLIRIKEKKNLFFIDGELFNNHENFDIKKLRPIIGDLFDILNTEKINFSSVNVFSFNVDRKLKFNDLKLETNIDLKHLKINTENLNLKPYLPNFEDQIILKNHKIKIKFNKDKLDISGKGNFYLEDKFDNLSYRILSDGTKISFDTIFRIKNNPFIIKFLEYEKKEGINSDISIKGVYKKNKELLFQVISLKERKNQILIKNLLVNENTKIINVDLINLNYKNDKNILNKIELKKDKSNIYIKGKNFDATKLIDNIMENTKDNKSIFQNLNSKVFITIDKTYINKDDYVNKLSGYLIYKENKINELNLKSIFPNDKKINLSIQTNGEKETITNFFTGYPKALIKRYDFIKGFEEGYLNFYSVKKNGVSNSVLVIDNFKVREVPAFAKLLSLASLQGIADLLTGEGIRFTDFEMSYSTQKGLINIEEMYAIGPAVSILMDGYIEKKKLISLRGTLVPATTINRSIASIPLLGKILIGEKTGEGVFGVSFKIKGLPKNLSTTVNPIKTLTPRFITRTLEKIKKN